MTDVDGLSDKNESEIVWKEDTVRSNLNLESLFVKIHFFF